MMWKPAFWRTLSEAMLSLAARACSGRAGTSLSRSSRAWVAIPRPRAGRSIQLVSWNAHPRPLNDSTECGAASQYSRLVQQPWRPTPASCGRRRVYDLH